jgi:hypothetical protein
VHRRVVLAVYYGLAVVAGVADGLVPYGTSAAFVEAAFSVVVIIVGYFLLGERGFAKHFVAWLVLAVIAGLAVSVVVGR